MRPVAIFTLSALIFGCGGGSPDQGPSAEDAVADAMSDAGVVMPTTLQAMKLEERDVERFISVLTEFDRLGVKVDENAGDNPSDISSVMQGLGANAEALAVLRDHDLDVMKFQQLAMSVMMAAAASEMEANPPDPSVEQAQLEQMKATMPPEQYEAMMKVRESATAMMSGMNNQPEGNVELVARYRDKLDAIGNKNR